MDKNLVVHFYPQAMNWKILPQLGRKAPFLYLMILLWGISPAWGQENESGANNDTPGAGQLIGTFPNQLNGSLESGDVDFWTIPDGTAGDFQVLDIFNVNLLFSSLDVQLYEYTNAARTTGLITTVLSETTVITLDGSKYYSLRISGNNGTPVISIPSSINTFSELLSLVAPIRDQVDDYASQFTNVPLLIDILQFGLAVLEGVIQFQVGIGNGNSNVPALLLNTIQLTLDAALNNPIDIYGVTFIQSSGSSGSGGALPVVWADFSAKLVSTQVELFWATASEQNNSGFSVEYSQDALNWESLGFVEGTGTTNELNSYTFVHDRPGLGFNYYRLKQIDFNGDFEYSEIREVIQQGELASTAFQVYPNPTVDMLHVSPLVGRLFLRDLTGKILQERQVQGSWSLLDLSSYPSGIYLLQLDPSEGTLSSYSIQKN